MVERCTARVSIKRTLDRPQWNRLPIIWMPSDPRFCYRCGRRPEPRNFLQKWMESITSEGGWTMKPEPVHERTDHRDLAGAGSLSEPA